MFYFFFKLSKRHTTNAIWCKITQIAIKSSIYFGAPIFLYILKTPTLRLSEYVNLLGVQSILSALFQFDEKQSSYATWRYSLVFRVVIPRFSADADLICPQCQHHSCVSRSASQITFKENSVSDYQATHSLPSGRDHILSLSLFPAMFLRPSKSQNHTRKRPSLLVQGNYT